MSRADFDGWLCLSIAGPPSEATGERWLNFTVRLAESREVIGRLEANIHDHLAELAFLYTPRLWGCGYASQGLLWLQSQLRENTSVQSFWATTHPENQRSAGLLERQGYVRMPTQGYTKVGITYFVLGDGRQENHVLVGGDANERLKAQATIGLQLQSSAS